jgi:hypothetical protein
MSPALADVMAVKLQYDRLISRAPLLHWLEQEILVRDVRAPELARVGHNEDNVKAGKRQRKAS